MKTIFESWAMFTTKIYITNKNVIIAGLFGIDKKIIPFKNISTIQHNNIFSKAEIITNDSKKHLIQFYRMRDYQKFMRKVQKYV